MAYTEQQVMEAIPVIRPVLEQIAHKWSILVLTFLCEKPKRFNALKRRLNGITQKALTDTLRRLERNGLVRRDVTTRSPIAVVYSITPLGRTLQAPFLSLYDWAIQHRVELEGAQQQFDVFAEPCGQCRSFSQTNADGKPVPTAEQTSGS